MNNTNRNSIVIDDNAPDFGSVVVPENNNENKHPETPKIIEEKKEEPKVEEARAVSHKDIEKDKKTIEEENAYRKEYYERIEKDDFLRKYALQSLVDGYYELDAKINFTTAVVEEMNKNIIDFDANLEAYIENRKEELASDIKALEDKVTVLNAQGFNIVAKAMIEQTKEFKGFLDNETDGFVREFNEAIQKADINKAIKKNIAIASLFLIAMQILAMAFVIIMFKNQ